MRLLVLGLITVFLTSCACNPKSGEAVATAGERTPAAVACDPNQFSPAFLDELRREIASRYGEDFGARCTETKRLPLTKSDYKDKQASSKKDKKEKKDSWDKKEEKKSEKKTTFGDRKYQFAYDTEGCAGYRAEACSAATTAWIQKAGKFKSEDGAGSAK